MAGVEYQLLDPLKLRLGYAYQTSATPKDYAKQYMAPPGPTQYILGGFGFEVIKSLDIDLAGGFVFGRTFVSVATKDNAGIGYYSTYCGHVALSATYRL
jgi:long-subunit fatty acid transport protein